MKYENQRAMPAIGFAFRDKKYSKEIQRIVDVFFRHYSAAFPEHLHLVPVASSFAYNLLKIPFLGLIWIYSKKTPENNVFMPIGNLGAAHQNLTLYNEKFVSDIYMISPIRLISSMNRKYTLQDIYCRLYDRDVFLEKLKTEPNARKRRVWEIRSQNIESSLRYWYWNAVFWGIAGNNNNVLQDVSMFLPQE